MTAAGVPCGLVNTVAEAFADPHTEARDLVVEIEHPVLGAVRQPASAVRVGDEKIPHRRAPMLNEDADYVLHDLLGYDESRLGELTSEGAFGPLDS